MGTASQTVEQGRLRAHLHTPQVLPVAAPSSGGGGGAVACCRAPRELQARRSRGAEHDACRGVHGCASGELFARAGVVSEGKGQQDAPLAQNRYGRRENVICSTMGTAPLGQGAPALRCAAAAAATRHLTSRGALCFALLQLLALNCSARGERREQTCARAKSFSAPPRLTAGKHQAGGPGECVHASMPASCGSCLRLLVSTAAATAASAAAAATATTSAASVKVCAVLSCLLCAAGPQHGGPPG